MANQSILNHIHIKKGDITKEKTDAIVNAANTSLLGGGGVDGAIHSAAGPNLLKECASLGGCNPGEARITGGYNLPSKYVIHTPGPIYRDGNQDEKKTLVNSYSNSMNLAKENNLKSISFSAISTGVYSYPPKEACEVAMQTVIDFIKNNDFQIDVYFVLYNDENFNLYNKQLEKMKK